MSGDDSVIEEQASRKLKLVLKTSSTPASPGSGQNEDVKPKDGSSSPPRPSYSPVTPTLSHEKLALPEEPEKHLIAEPPPLPLSLEDNADAIALKATISLLQMQRQQSLKDIRDLDKIKDAALENPQGFVDDLRTGKLKKAMPSEVVFDDVEYEDEETEPHEGKTEGDSRFGPLPNAQNVARCPPIEWAKYHIVGQPLDAMHETQKRYPGASESYFGNVTAQEHEITAPYRPFKDRLNPKKEAR